MRFPEARGPARGGHPYPDDSDMARLQGCAEHDVLHPHCRPRRSRRDQPSRPLTAASAWSASNADPAPRAALTHRREIAYPKGAPPCQGDRPRTVRAAADGHDGEPTPTPDRSNDRRRGGGDVADVGCTDGDQGIYGARGAVGDHGQGIGCISEAGWEADWAADGDRGTPRHGGRGDGGRRGGPGVCGAASKGGAGRGSGGTGGCGGEAARERERLPEHRPRRAARQGDRVRLRARPVLLTG
ncbi:uncharacterized protein SOCE836_003260 [Sorangium cellulosum]|uniref:Uncharacterized protein n=1 Tax=Sorangium cellulosum TaxID=56 RepID=A0A4P2QFM2_SORCE|nr:uncharacterized protein SOCE836_003260 [Sorangium cellulosum]WCQ87650.1 hypothetical protein NQZ70_00313 [Sorangium sp. Soce836]